MTMQKIEDYIRDEVFAKPLRNWGVLVIYDPGDLYFRPCLETSVDIYHTI